MTVKNPSYHMIARIFYSFIHRVSGRCFYSPRAEPKRLLSGVLSAVKSDLLCVPITMAIIASEFGYDLAKNYSRPQPREISRNRGLCAGGSWFIERYA